MALGDLIEFNIHCVLNKIQFEEVTCYSSYIDFSDFLNMLLGRNLVLILLVLTLYNK